MRELGGRKVEINFYTPTFSCFSQLPNHVLPRATALPALPKALSVLSRPLLLLLTPRPALACTLLPPASTLPALSQPLSLLSRSLPALSRPLSLLGAGLSPAAGGPLLFPLVPPAPPGNLLKPFGKYGLGAGNYLSCVTLTLTIRAPGPTSWAALSSNQLLLPYLVLVSCPFRRPPTAPFPGLG
jgi:hypothetical protein